MIPFPKPVRVLFRLLLRLLPAEEREELGPRVLADIERGWDERRRSGGLARAMRFVAREALDLVRNGVESRAASTTRTAGLGFDSRVAVRGLLRTPALSIGATVTLGVGVGASLALFSVLHQVILRPLPYGDPRELVTVYSVWEGTQELGVTWRDIEALHDEAATLDGVAGVLLPGLDSHFVLTTPGGREAVEAVRVSPNFFRVLKSSPALGPGIRAAHPFEETVDAVLVTDAAWRTRWGADPDLVGRTVRINESAYEVAGVLSPDFAFQLGARRPELYVVRAPGERERLDRSNLAVLPIARLRPEASATDAAAEVDRLQPLLDAERAKEVGALPLGVRSLREHLVGDLAAPLWTMGVAALLVLIMACANLAAVFVARHTGRKADQALRAALGAGRSRLARVPMAEALVVGLVGGIVGLGLAGAGSELVLERVPDTIFRYDGFHVGPGIVAGTLALSVVAAVLSGGLPAWQASGIRPAEVLRGRGSRGGSGTTGATRSLAGVQAAVLVVLLVATGLSLRSLRALVEVELGFETGGRAAATLLLPGERHGPEAFDAFIDEFESRLEALPGVRAAGTITHLPLDPDSWGGSLAVEGAPLEEGRATEWELASPGYFDAAGIERLRGRTFTDDDRRSGPRVAVVSRELARTIRPSGDLGDVLGTRVSGTGPEGPWMEIVGVVEDVRQRGVAKEPRPHLYVSHAQSWPYPERELVLAVEPDAPGGGATPLSALAEAAVVVREMDPAALLARPRSLETLVHRALGRPRVATSLLGLFAAASLLVALAGVYGTTAFAVARRRREIGIRACLGAQGRALFSRALAETMVPVSAGSAVGVVVAGVLAPRLDHLLYGVAPLDLPTLVGVPLLLMGTAFATAFYPAFRASRIDPAEVLGDG